MTETTYYRTKVVIYDKPALYDAIRECHLNALTTPPTKLSTTSLTKSSTTKLPTQSSNPLLISMPIPSSKTTSDCIVGERFILTQQQKEQLRDNRAHIIVCSHAQILLYYNCVDIATWKKILDGENP